MKPILEVRNIGKQYKLAGNAKPYLSLRESLFDLFKVNKKAKEDGLFWALEDISFDVYPGDTVGIIGRNGAGKSTLLKILSKITPPTKGFIKARGRVASLLEVGTGFHPELSGRENIFLNGSILGLTRKEISQKFDEIVDFSGVEKFIDTPLKHYSSGMQLRLAFAVAAHLEPEILVIDEVLAVGDAEFQKKCLGKMDEVSKSGRTILFVSHNMGAVSSLCKRSILLQNGEIKSIGTTKEIISSYFSNSNHSPYSFDLSDRKGIYSDDLVELMAGQVQNSEGVNQGNFLINEAIEIKLFYKVKKNIDARIVPSLHVNNNQGQLIFVCNALNVKPLDTGEYEATCNVPANFLNDGVHFVSIAISTYYKVGYKVNLDYRDALSFEVEDILHDNPLRYNYSGPIPGSIRPKLDFQVKKKSQINNELLVNIK